MAKGPANQVRGMRLARGLSQGALAAAAQLSRQSLHAIEAGGVSPAVDVALRLARALGCAVEALFGESAGEARFTVEPVGNAAPGRVALAHVSGRWLSYSLALEGIGRCADGIASTTRGRVQVEPLRPSAECRNNVVIMGCAPALGLLADRLNAHAGPGRFLWLARSSTGSLAALAKQQTHVAGVHLVDEKTGESNVPDVRRHAGKRAVVMITLARWEAGLLLAAGNPKRISGVSGLENRGVRLVSRERGSGARRLLDSALRRAALPPGVASGAALQASGHLEVARAIALGAADAGIATRDAALAFGLAFVPLAEERYDLVVPQGELGDPRLTRLLEVMTSGAFRRELSSLGYDVTQCGDRVAEIAAA
jgi:putative molybdopterin biosynthesis protein